MQNKLNFWVFLVMFLVLSCRCVIQLMPSLGFPLVSTILSVGSTLSAFYCVFLGFRSNEIVANKNFLVAFAVYIAFITYELFYANIVPLEECQHGPEDEFTFFRNTCDILMLSMLAFMITRHLNFEKFARWTVILTLIFLAVYYMRVGFQAYALMYGVGTYQRENLMPEGFIDALIMSRFVGLMLCCNLFLYDRWTSKKVLNLIIFSSISVLGFVLLALLIERGPLLFYIIAMLIMFIAKGTLKPKYGFFMIFLALIFIFFSDELMGQFQSLFPEIHDKFSDTSGSGRYGANSITDYAINQILDHPFLGHYCRLVDVSNYGEYPHNMILELCMTMGLFLAIPIIYMLYKAFVQSYNLIKYNRPESLIAFIFIYRTLCLMTSSTILSNTQFWFSFAFVLATTKYVEFKNTQEYNIEN